VEVTVTNRSSFVCSAAFLLALGSIPVHAQTSAQTGNEAKPAVVVANVSTLNAKVTGVDKAQRLVTLRTDDGREQTIKCGPEVRNFDQIEVGDNVMAEFHEATAIFARKPEAAAGATGAESRSGPKSYGTAELAPLGAKPGGLITNVTEVTATVEDIDYAKRQVKVLGPSGQPRVVTVGNDVQNLENVKKGDEVVLRYTEALAISVTK
jgi:hypothetical protein